MVFNALNTHTGNGCASGQEILVNLWICSLVSPMEGSVWSRAMRPGEGSVCIKELCSWIFESSWPGVFPISEISLICLVSGISLFSIIMVFLKGFVLPLGKLRNSNFLSAIKNPKPKRPTKQNQNPTKKSKQLPKHRNTVTHSYRSNIFFFLYDTFLPVVSVCDTLRFEWFILLLIFRITAGSDVKLVCFLFTFFLLNLLAICFQIGFSYLLFFLKWYFDALFLSAVAVDGLVFIGMQESWWGYWSMLVFFSFLSHGHLDWAICLPNSGNAEERHFLFSSHMNCTFIWRLFTCK